MAAESHENSNILDLMDSSNPNFDSGSRNMWGFFFVMQILIPIYYVRHS
jgi:hypothetical protein